MLPCSAAAAAAIVAEITENAPIALQQNLSLPVSPEAIHPTIMHDMRAFEGVLGTTVDPQFNLDLPSTSFTSTQMASDLFPEFTFNDAILASSELHPSQAETVNGLPVLDATWQSFVEQLGF